MSERTPKPSPRAGTATSGSTGRSGSGKVRQPSTSSARRSNTTRRPASARRSDTAAEPASDQSDKPRGRDDVVNAIISAAHRILVAGGPAKLTLRAVADVAGVNRGLIHRHFGSKAAVVRAAAERTSQQTRALVDDAPDLAAAVRLLFEAGSARFAREVAWAILQADTSSVLPTSFPTLDRLCELAAGDNDGSDDERERVAVLMSLVLGWRLFEPYLRVALHFDDVDRKTLDVRIESMLDQIASHPFSGVEVPPPASRSTDRKRR